MKKKLLLIGIIVMMVFIVGCIQEIHEGKFSIDVTYCDDICGKVTHVYYDGNDVLCFDENGTTWICSDYVDWFADEE